MDKKVINMTPKEIILSFVISYVAGLVPNNIFKRHKSMKEKLDLCFKRAVDRWTNHSETQKSVGEQMEKYFPCLKDYIAHKPIGRHPRVNDLLRLWTEEILNDEECHQYISSCEHEIMALKLDENLLTAQEVLEEVNNIKNQIEQFKNRGITNCHLYWEQWSTGPIKLNTEILLAGREDERQKVLDKCNAPNCLYIEATSVKEAIAFAVASIISESEILAERTVVATNIDAYKDIVENSPGMIFITNIQENAHYIVSRGHTVILCICPYDKHNEMCTIVHLPILNREGFIKSLTDSGINEAKAQSYAVNSARDIYVLRNLLGFSDNPPAWQTFENIRLIVPALLLGEWNEEWNDDKDIVKLMTGKEYANYVEDITPLLHVDEAPLVRIGKIWKVRSPFELMPQLVKYVTQSHLDKFAEVIEWMLQDDDPDAEAKMNTKELRWWQNKQAFSGNIKEGVFQGLALLATVQNRILGNTDWVDNFIDCKLKEFNLKRYLTHRHNLKWLAEASPVSFLKFLQNDIKNGAPLLKQLMDVKHKEFSFSGSEIYYTELLFILESLAWDEQYLLETTDILMTLCVYPNDSNYSNKPINSLIQIYRFILPQTYSSFEDRLQVLKKLAERHRNIVSNLCIELLKGLDNRVFMYNSHFRWRLLERKESPRNVSPILPSNIIKIANLLLETCTFSIDDIGEILDLSFHRNMKCCREMLLDAIKIHIEIIKGNEKITENLRKNINHHLQYKDAVWALTEQDLQPYMELLNELESDDILIKNKHLFVNFLIKEPDLQDFDKDYLEKIKESRAIRGKVINEIIQQKGLGAVWDFEKMVKYKESIADALFDLYGSELRHDIYKKYCDGQLDEIFVKRYFRNIYYEQGEDSYIPIIQELKTISEKNISIIFYAPDYQTSLSNMISTFPSDIEKEYWSKVSIWECPETEIESVLMKLCYVERYDNVLEIATVERNSNIISEDLKVCILCEMQSKFKWDILKSNAYQVAKILKTISLPGDIGQKSMLLQMELFMFDYLRHYINVGDIHLVQEINKDPSLLMEIYSLVFRADKGHEEESVEESQKVMAHLAFNFIFNYHEVPCSNSSGEIDENALSEYFKKLKFQAEQCHRTHILPMIIGRILGNFKEKEDYPSEILCRFVEQFDNDHIDSEIYCALSNRRGFTSRAYNEGGSIERDYIETLTKYRDNARFRSPRLTRIFENLIKEYQKMAEIEDNKAKLLDMTN